jgi:hypothetical protein
MVLPRGSSSSSADPNGAGSAGLVQPPRRFERAVSALRFAGGVAALLIGPLLPNLGVGYVLALSGFLLLWAAVLYVLSDRATTLADQQRISEVVFVGDSVVAFLGMLAVTPDPNWLLFPLFAVLFIISAAFRLGDVGAALATLIVAIEFLGVALWREYALGLPTQLPYLALVVLTASPR